MRLDLAHESMLRFQLTDLLVHVQSAIFAAREKIGQYGMMRRNLVEQHFVIRCKGGVQRLDRHLVRPVWMLLEHNYTP